MVIHVTSGFWSRDFFFKILELHHWSTKSGDHQLRERSFIPFFTRFYIYQVASRISEPSTVSLARKVSENWLETDLFEGKQCTNLLGASFVCFECCPFLENLVPSNIEKGLLNQQLITPTKRDEDFWQKISPLYRIPPNKNMKPYLPVTSHKNYRCWFQPNLQKNWV